MKQQFVFAVALTGPVWAAVQFGEVIARKDLGASPIQITLLTMVMPIANLTAIWWSRLLVGRDQRPLVLGMGLIGSAAMISGLWLHSFLHLFLAFFFYYLSYAVTTTGQNRLLQQHIRTGTQGGVFGFSTGIRMGAAALVSWLAGMWMDSTFEGYRHLYFMAGLITVISTLIFASMPTKEDPNVPRQGLNRKILLGPLVEAGKLLKRRPDYLRFEIGFMIYGMAFIGLLPVVPLFLVDDLGFDYTTIGVARGTVQQLVMIPSVWFFGRLFDRMTPHAMAAWVFSSLSLHPLLLISAAYLPENLALVAVMLSYACFGAAMGGVSVLWFVSSVSFARDEDAGVYQAVHMAATAIRGIAAPLLAYAVMTFAGKLAALWMAVIFWLVAGTYMARLNRTDGREHARLNGQASSS